MSATRYKKIACRYLDLYRNDKRKNQGIKKKHLVHMVNENKVKVPILIALLLRKDRHLKNVTVKGPKKYLRYGSVLFFLTIFSWK